MEVTELLEIIARGEDSKHQFKRNFTNEISLAQEMVAFSNSGGGQIFIGVEDSGQIAGLSFSDVARLNKLISNTASQQVKNSINPQTENIALGDGVVIVVNVLDGIRKPYSDKDGVFWVKSGADKRKATSIEEIQRLFQKSGLLHGDEEISNGMSVADIDLDYFSKFFKREYGMFLDEQDIALPQILENMNLMKSGVLNISGALLFSNNVAVRFPRSVVKAVCYPGNDIDNSEYLDSQDISGKLADVFQQSLSFIVRNLKHVQGDRSINSTGATEIPRSALEELLANALVHRDFFISSNVRLFIFRDRIEIISPGHLPNNLTIENVKSGNSNIRNPILSSYATKILPYRGLGTGIRRALAEYSDIDFIDDRDGNMFKVIIKRVSL